MTAGLRLNVTVTCREEVHITLFIVNSFVVLIIGISMCNAIIGLKVHIVTVYLQSLLKCV